MDRWAGTTAVVTGASSGIGAAVARALRAHGLHVVGLARRPELVEQLNASGAGPAVRALRCDVAAPGQLARAFASLGAVHVLVNNAAVFPRGHITEIGSNPLSEEEIISELDTNIKGVVLCARHAAASMRKWNVDGIIININSIAGHYTPFSDSFNVYPSCKHAVTALTRSLAVELAAAGSKIKITSISPGLTATALVGVGHPGAGVPALAPEDVADAVVYVMSTPPHVNISELTIQPVGEKRL